jgi:Fic family protein
VGDAITLATFVHAELIRIHPFIDGNGRVARAILDWILLGLGFPWTVAFHIPTQEYREALNHYYRTGDIQPVADLVLRAFAFAIG